MLIELVVHQYTNALDHELIETHVFPDGDALQAWLDSQETTVFLEFEPREEVIDRSTILKVPAPQECSNPEVEHPGFACAHPPMDPALQDPLDVCQGCGGIVEDFAWGGFEAANGQRGHTAHVKTVRWDTVHNREADIYCPPEDIELRIVGPR